jgi:hypothetical protein
MNSKSPGEAKASRNSPSGAAKAQRFGKRSASIILLLALLFGTFATYPAQASGSCTQANAVKVVSGAKFLCKKVSGKLQWVKQGSNAVVNNRPSSPAPSAAVKEWTKCSTAGKVSGSGDKALSCVKVSGKLQWVKNTTLDTPVPKRPCRSEGQIGNWQGEVVLCTPYSSGKIWQIPQFDDELEVTPNEPTGLTQYRLNNLDCHSTATNADVEVQEAGNWKRLKSSDFVANSACSAGLYRLQATVDLVPGTVARLRVYTPRWSWVTSPVTVGITPDLTLYNLGGVSLTPATARVTMPQAAAGLNFSLEFVSYKEIGTESVFRFRLADRPTSVVFTSAANFVTNRGVAAITGQPGGGSLLNPKGEFEILVKRSSIQWDLTRFEFDFYGQVVGTNFAYKILTDFTWR